MRKGIAVILLRLNFKVTLAVLVKTNEDEATAVVRQCDDLFGEFGLLGIFLEATKPILDLHIEAFMKIVDKELDSVGLHG